MLLAKWGILGQLKCKKSSIISIWDVGDVLKTFPHQLVIQYLKFTCTFISWNYSVLYKTSRFDGANVKGWSLLKTSLGAKYS